MPKTRLQQVTLRIGTLVFWKPALVVLCGSLLAILIIGIYIVDPGDRSATERTLPLAGTSVASVASEGPSLDVLAPPGSMAPVIPAEARTASVTASALAGKIVTPTVISSPIELLPDPPLMAAPTTASFGTAQPTPGVPLERVTQTPTEQAIAPPSEPTPEPYLPIARLVIPSIGIDAAVEVRGVNPDGVMQTPGGPDVVAWYDFSSPPDGGGNAVFAGHLDYAGYGPAVFWDLHELQAGDLIEVYMQDGTMVLYRVTEVRSFAADDDPSEAVSSKGRPTITLITCDGSFDSGLREYDERLVVTGDRVD